VQIDAGGPNGAVEWAVAPSGLQKPLSRKHVHPAISEHACAVHLMPGEGVPEADLAARRPIDAVACEPLEVGGVHHRPGRQCKRLDHHPSSADIKLPIDAVQRSLSRQKLRLRRGTGLVGVGSLFALRRVEKRVEPPMRFFAVDHRAESFKPLSGTTLAASSPSVRETTLQSQASSFSAALRR
jgi:hypothetical protein